MMLNYWNMLMIKLKKLLKEWSNQKVVLGKLYTEKDNPPFKTPKQIQNEAPMSDTKKGFLMLKIWGQSWSVNMGKVFKGVNREKPAMIKKGLKELKILHKKIEEQIEELI